MTDTEYLEVLILFFIFFDGNLTQTQSLYQAAPKTMEYKNYGCTDFYKE